MYARRRSAFWTAKVALAAIPPIRPASFTLIFMIAIMPLIGFEPIRTSIPRKRSAN